MSPSALENPSSSPTDAPQSAQTAPWCIVGTQGVVGDWGFSSRDNGMEADYRDDIGLYRDYRV